MCKTVSLEKATAEVVDGYVNKRFQFAGGDVITLWESLSMEDGPRIGLSMDFCKNVDGVHRVQMFLDRDEARNIARELDYFARHGEMTLELDNE